VDHLPVTDVMATAPVAVESNISLDAAARTMLEHMVHRVFVLEDGRLQGVLSTRDVMMATRDSRLRQPIADYMSSPVFTIGAYEPISAANELLGRARISGLVVTDLGMPIGIYTQREALGASSKPQSAAVESAMNAAIACTPPALPVFRAASQAVAMKVRRVVAVSDGELVGVMSGLDFVRAHTAARG
jgi:CBS domain-containing protein